MTSPEVWILRNSHVPSSLRGLPCTLVREEEAETRPLPPSLWALRFHPGPALWAAESSGGILWSVRFRGREAPGVLPATGRDGGAAAELTLHALELARIPPAWARILPRGPEGTIPGEATLDLVTPDPEAPEEERLRALATGCAAALGVTLEELRSRPLPPLRPHAPFRDRARRVLARRGIPLEEGPVPPTLLGALSLRIPLGFLQIPPLPPRRLRSLLKALAAPEGPP